MYIPNVNQMKVVFQKHGETEARVDIQPANLSGTLSPEVDGKLGMKSML